jgi:hypothetical protein
MVIASLLRRLWARPLPRQHRFESLKAICDRWAAEFEASVNAAPRGIDPGLARSAIALLARRAARGGRGRPRGVSRSGAGRRNSPATIATRRTGASSGEGRAHGMSAATSSAPRPARPIRTGPGRPADRPGPRSAAERPACLCRVSGRTRSSSRRSRGRRPRSGRATRRSRRVSPPLRGQRHRVDDPNRCSRRRPNLPSPCASSAGYGCAASIRPAPTEPGCRDARARAAAPSRTALTRRPGGRATNARRPGSVESATTPGAEP